jgi:hypothetical protein
MDSVFHSGPSAVCLFDWIHLFTATSGEHLAEIIEVKQMERNLKFEMIRIRWACYGRDGTITRASLKKWLANHLLIGAEEAI